MPSAASSGIASRASRATFWPETASRWLSPARRKSSTVRRVDPLVLAEDEAARQLRLARRHAPAEAVLGAAADLVAVGERQRDHGDDAEHERAAAGARRASRA